MYNPTFTGRPDQPLTNIVTSESQQAMINGTVGDFISFQGRFESGSHGAVHRMVGGCVDFLYPLWFRPLTKVLQ